MPLVALLLISILSTLAVAGCAGSSADEPPIPIWWSPLLELESLDAIDDRLDRELPGDAFYRFSPPYTSTGETEFVRSCRDAFRVMPSTSSADRDSGSPLHPDTAIEFFYHCDLLTRLKTAVPSKTSYLPALTPDLSLFGHLPALTEGFANDYGFCVTARISEAGHSWGDVIAMDRLQPDWDGWTRFEGAAALIESSLARPHRWADLARKPPDSLEIRFFESERDAATGRHIKIRVKVRDVNYSLYPLARADFDRDGYEDLALAVFWKAGGVSYYSHFQIIARVRPEGAISVINLEDFFNSESEKEVCK